MVHRDKWYCPQCDWAAKGPCPRHGGLLLHSSWRPGRKGSKTRLWDARVTRHRREAARMKGKYYVHYYGPPPFAPKED